MKELLSEKEILQAVDDIAKEIDSDLEKSYGLPPIMICVLNGAVIFYTDLIRAMKTRLETDFVRAKSYVGQDNSGGVKILKDIESDITGRDVYIVEDIIDSGETMKELYIHLSQKSPKTLKVVTLLKRRGTNHPYDHYGIEIGDEWVVGYGLDDNGLNRNCRYIYDIKGE